MPDRQERLQTSGVAAPPALEPRHLLADLRQARRRNRVAEIDWVDALYRAYLTAVLAIAALVYASGLVGDQPLSAQALRQLRSDGPAWLGLVAATAVFVGIRSGSRGGPLALEAPDVRFVLAAPVPRALALRRPIWHQLRFGVFAGAAVGAAAGQVAAQRLPHHSLQWAGAGAALGGLAALAALGAALVVSGRRLPRLAATVVACAVVAWSVVDLLAGTDTSPLTHLGRLGIWPLRSPGPEVLLGVAVAVALPAIGLSQAGGTSLEAAERRASLVGQLRFAATLQDLRTVLVLRRQLAQERARARPWLRLPARPTQRPRFWLRGWHGLLRWPAPRIARAILLAVAAGVAAHEAWTRATPLLVVSGLALYVVALDVVEPMAQELDHDRVDTVPAERGAVLLRLLAAPVAAMVVVALPAAAVAVVLGPLDVAGPVAAAVLLPAALTAVAGATVATVFGPAPAMTDRDVFFPEGYGMKLLARMVWPAVLATSGLVPVLVAREARADDGSPGLAAVAAALAVLVLVAFVAAWLRFRDPARAWINGFFERRA